MKKIRTHYDNLQVVETASDEVIKGAYKYLSQKWHPDKHPNHREVAERKIKIINAAYEVLSDPQRRKEHDEWIAAQRAAQGTGTTSSAGPEPWSDDTDDPAPRPGDPKPLGKSPFPKWRFALLIALAVAVVGYVKGVVPGEPHVVPGEPHLFNSFRDPLKIGGFGPDMVALPGGTFTMGSPDTEQERGNAEGPQHRVTVPAFALGRTEVSFADYDRFAGATDRKKPDDRGWGRGERPVINVSADDARAYAVWLSEQTGQQYRLPTEAEWEYAARAGTTTPFWTGDCISTNQANYDGNYDYDACGAKTGVYRAKTVPVGSLPANAFGLHEMAGNVYEWTADCWHDNYYRAPTDGSAWRGANGGDCARRVLRGGSWFGSPLNLRSANRGRNTADGANDIVGIRLARTP